MTRTWARIQRTTPSHRQISTESHRCRQVIAERNAAVNAFAQTSDVTPTTSTATLPLSGHPIAIKDNICTKAMPTTCASNMLKGGFDPLLLTVYCTLTRNPRPCCRLQPAVRRDGRPPPPRRRRRHHREDELRRVRYGVSWFWLSLSLLFSIFYFLLLTSYFLSLIY